MKKPAIVTLVLVAAFALAAYLGNQENLIDRGSLALKAPTTVAGPDHLEPKQASVERTEVAADLRESKPTPGAELPDAEQLEHRKFEIVGRFVTLEGAGIEGVRISITGHPGIIGDEREEKRVAMTDSNGAFALHFDVELTFGQFFARATKPGWSTRQAGLWQTLGDYEKDRYDLGDVIMLPGGNVHGIVLDQNDKPIPKAAIDFRWIKPDISTKEEAEAQAAMASSGLLSVEADPNVTDSFEPAGIMDSGAHCDEDGRFGTRLAMRAGQWRIRVRGKSIQSWDLERVTVRANQNTEITIRCILKPPITVSMDGLGTGIQGFFLRAIGTESGKPAGKVRSVEPHGNFQITANPNADDQIRLTTADGSPFIIEHEVLARWGDHIQLSATKLPSVRVLVLDARDDSPVGDYNLSLTKRRGDFLARRLHKIQDGFAELGGLEAGRYTLYVIPLDSEERFASNALAAAGPFPVNAAVITDPDQPTIVVRVEVPKPIQVKVVDASGLPVTQATVSLIGSPIDGPKYSLGTRTHFALQGDFMHRPGPHISWTKHETGTNGMCEPGLPRVRDERISILATHDRWGSILIPYDPSLDTHVLRYNENGSVQCEFVGAWPARLSRVQLEQVDLPGNLHPAYSSAPSFGKQSVTIVSRSLRNLASADHGAQCGMQV